MIQMNKTKKIGLDVGQIDNLIKSLNTLSKDLKNLPNEVCQEVSELGLQYLESQYLSTNTDHTIDIGSIDTGVKKLTNGYQIYASGKDVLYAEFGTGEEGKASPHPEKSKFPLNDYNSGYWVSRLINTRTGKHFWIYQGQYSEGNPSGKQVFNTRNFLKDKGIKMILNKKGSEVISKVQIHN